jgi:hypothetical protein
MFSSMSSMILKKFTYKMSHVLHFRVFDSLWTLLRPIMTEQTQQALKIFGHNKAEWREEFSKQIPLDQIRHSFGGTKDI